MESTSDRPAIATCRALAVAFLLLALSFAIVRYPPWVHISVLHHGVEEDEMPSLATRALKSFTAVLVVWWWIFTAAALVLAALAWMGRLGRRGWISVAAVTLVSGLWIGYAWLSYQAAMRRLTEGG